LATGCVRKTSLPDVIAPHNCDLAECQSMILPLRNEFVPHALSIVWICVAATSVASPAIAFDPDNAWRRTGAPLASSAYVAPSPAINGALAQVDLSHPANDASAGLSSIFDEVRLGLTTFRPNSNGNEDGAFITGEVLFKPFVAPLGNRYLDVLLRPRPDIGFSVSTEDGTNQLYGGVTWTVPLPSIFFLEGSFGGTIHDGPLHDEPLSLGCRVLFRESLGLGAEFGNHWRIVGGVDHASHANLCGNENDGLTHYGASIGYRF